MSKAAQAALTPVPIPALIEDEHFRFYVELEFDRPELNVLRDILRQKSAAKGYVVRADFEARAIKQYLRNMLVLDVVEQPDGSRRYRYRNMGMAIVEAFGEQTGRYVDEFIPPSKIARWTAGHDLIVLSGRPMRFVVNYTSPQVNYLRSEGLFFPLMSEDDRFTQIMGFNYLSPRVT